MAARKKSVKRGTKKETRGRKKGSTKVGTAEFSEYRKSVDEMFNHVIVRIEHMTERLDKLSRELRLAEYGESAVDTLTAPAQADEENEASVAAEEVQAAEVHQNGALEPASTLSI